MKIGPLFWVLMILAVLAFFGALFWEPKIAIGNDILVFVLLGLLGWQNFGPAIQK